MPIGSTGELDVVGFTGLDTDTLSTQPDPSYFGDQLPAAFRQFNTIGSMIANDERSPHFDDFIDLEFDAFPLIKGTHYQEFSSAFILANTVEQVELVKMKIDAELEDRELVASGGGIVAGLLAGILDPVNLIPVGGTALKTARVGEAALAGAKNVGKAGFASIVTAEAILQGTQETRPAIESAVVVTAGTILSATLGAGIGAIGQTRRNMVARIEADLRMPPPDGADPLEPGFITMTAAEAAEDTSLSAAQSRTETLAELTLKKAFGLEKLPTSPHLRMMTSPFIESRRSFSDLGESSLAIELAEGGTKALPPAIETLVKMHTAKLGEVITFMDSAFTRHRGGGEKSFGQIAKIGATDIAKGGAPEGKFTYQAFREEAGKAMRSGDTHAVAEIEEVAQEARRIIFDPIKEAMIAAKILPEDVDPKTALTYLTRMWDNEKVQAWRHTNTDLDNTPVHTRFLDYFKGERDKAVSFMQELEQRAAAAEGDLAKLTGQEAKLSATQKGTRKRQAAANTKKRNLKAQLKEAKVTERAAAKELADIEKRAAKLKEPEKGLEAEIRKAALKVEREEIAAAKASRIDKRLKNREKIKAAEAKGKAARAKLRDAKAVLREKKAKLSGRKERVKLKELEVTRTRATTTAARAQSRLAKLQEEVEANDFEIKLAAHQHDKAQTALDEMKRVVKSIKGRAINIRRQIGQEQEFSRLEDIELSDIAEKVIDRIQNTPGGRVPYEKLVIPRDRGPALERTFNIPDTMVDDLLVNDLEVVMRYFLRTMAPDIEMHKRFGDVAGITAISKINANATKLLREAGEAGDEKLVAKLEQRRRSDIADFLTIRDRIRGTRTAPADPSAFAPRAVSQIKNINYLRLLGGMTLSAVPDLGRPIMVEGLGATFRRGIIPFLTNFKQFRMQAREARRAGTAWDMVLDTRALELADIGDTFGRHSMFERATKAATNNFGLVSLMSPWNSAWKSFVGAMVTSRIVEESLNSVAGTISTGAATRLANSNINPRLAALIAKEFQEFGGGSQGGLFLAHTDRWQNGEAIQAIRAAIVRDVDRTIVTPKAGSRASWMDANLGGQLVGQVRSFAATATEDVLIAGLQQRDAAVLNGALVSVGLGVMVYVTKQWQAGREISDDWRVVLAEGVDRSGMHGFWYDLNNILEKGTRGTLGVNALVGGPMMSRYAARNVAGSVLGPTVGLFQDVGQVVGAFGSGDVRQSDVRAMRRMLPYQNLFYIRQLLDLAEGNINDALGIRK